jgi:hypothetical protein
MRRAVIVLTPVLLVLALTMWRNTGPAPLPASASDQRFSAHRAMSVLRGLLRDGTPHPIGSAANKLVRERVETELRRLGYDVSVQRRFACNAAATCGTVENVIARVPGQSRGDAVLLAAHYDSVASGPGASDDGQGVATLLEVARAIRNERMRNPVVFLIDDGEEAGLLGAEAFVADRALSQDVAAVINIEMRGTHGPSTMFETSRGNRWLIRHLARALDRPFANSLTYTVYQLLPNDTDVTVFKRDGKAAVNFAAVRGVKWYHTPFDDLRHVSLRTLQHHGDNVLGTVRALGDADLAARSATDAVYFDVLSLFLVWWPAEWTIWIGAGSLILLVFVARRTPPRAMTFGVLATFATILIAAAGGHLIALIARLGSDGVNFVARPTPSVVAMWLTGAAAALLGAAALNRRNDPQAMFYGAAIVWHVIAIVLALTVPGVAYVFLVPAVVATACGLARLEAVASGAVASVAAAIVVFPIALSLDEALGARMLAVIAVLVGVSGTLAAPLFARVRNGLALLLLALAAAALGAMQPPYDSERPEIINLSFIDDPASSPKWFAPRLTPKLREAAKFVRDDGALTPWSRFESWTADASGVRLPRVELRGERQGTKVTVRVLSGREADRIALLVRGGTIRSVNGVVPPPRPARFREPQLNGWRIAFAYAVQEAVFELDAPGRVEVVASDTTFGLPAGAEALIDARRASNASILGEGDLTITRARASF